MKCKQFPEHKIIKKGKRNNIQRYYCKNCKNYFQNEYRYKAYYIETNMLIVKLLKEGCGIRSISRIIQISPKTVMTKILKISGQIKAPLFFKHGCSYEVDEMWTFVNNKRNTQWITYAMERDSNTIIDFVV